jgi:hypothetical protein
MLRLFSAGLWYADLGGLLLTPRSVPEALKRRASTSGDDSCERPAMVSQDDISVAEIDWFLVNCYNLAVKVASTWPASAVSSLFDTAIQVGNHPFCLCTVSDEFLQITSLKTRFHPDLKNDGSLEDETRQCLCYFAIAIIWVAEGRRCPDIDNRVCMRFLHTQNMIY